MKLKYCNTHIDIDCSSITRSVVFENAFSEIQGRILLNTEHPSVTQ